MTGDNQPSGKVMDVTRPALAVVAVVAVALVLRSQADPAPVKTTPASWTVRPDGQIDLPVDTTGPTAEAPRLTLEVEVLDDNTGRRINDAVVWLNGYQVVKGCCPTIEIAATTVHTMAVYAPGYMAWEVVLKPREVTHKTVIRAPVRLQLVKLEF